MWQMCNIPLADKYGANLTHMWQVSEMWKIQYKGNSSLQTTKMWQMSHIHHNMFQVLNMWQIDKDIANWESGGNSHNVILI